MTQQDGVGSAGALPVDDESDQVVDSAGHGGSIGQDAPLERAASWLRLTSLRLSDDLEDAPVAVDTAHVMALFTAQFHTEEALALLEGRCGVMPDAGVLGSALSDGPGAHLTATECLDQVETELMKVPASLAPRDLASVWAEMAGARLALA